MAYLQAIGRGPTETKSDTRAQCTGCDWQGTHYRTVGPATRELLEHEKDTAQAAYGSLKRAYDLMHELLTRIARNGSNDYWRGDAYAVLDALADASRPPAAGGS